MGNNLPKEASQELREHLLRLKELGELSGDPDIIGAADAAFDVAQLSAEFRRNLSCTSADVSVFERGNQFATENGDGQVNIDAVQ